LHRSSSVAGTFSAEESADLTAVVVSVGSPVGLGRLSGLKAEIDAVGVLAATGSLPQPDSKAVNMHTPPKIVKRPRAFPANESVSRLHIDDVLPHPRQPSPEMDAVALKYSRCPSLPNDRSPRQGVVRHVASRERSSTSIG
jgi:hypothetical protein